MMHKMNHLKIQRNESKRGPAILKHLGKILKKYKSDIEHKRSKKNHTTNSLFALA